MFRWLMMIAVASVAVSVSAQGTDAKDCCAAMKPVVAQVQAMDCCAQKPGKGEDAFMAEAKRMMAKAEGKAGKDECCKSTAEKPMAKGDPGCCNAAGAPAKFKVFIAGQGYKYFGCEDSAGKGRSALAADGHKVGPVQKVNKARPI